MRVQGHGWFRAGLLALGAALAAAPGCRPTAIERIEDLRLATSPRLAATLARGTAGERARAALAMGRIQDPAFAPDLARAAAAGEREVRLAALFALGQLGLVEGVRPPEQAGATAAAAASDPDPEIAAAAVEALGKLADPAAIPRLVLAAAHPVAAVRVEAAHALFRLRFVPLWRKEVEVAPALPEAGLTALLAALHDPSPDVRRAAAHACSRYGEPEAVLDLQALVGDEDEWTRLFAARALGRSKDDQAAEVLRRAARDPSAAVRVEAVGALAALGRLEGVADLAGDGVARVREAVAAALGQARDPESIEVLHRLEQDGSPAVRAAAIPALARRLGADYGARILEWFTDADVRMRVAAARAAAQCGPAGTSWLATALEDADPRVQVAALEGLGPRGEGRAAVLAALAAPDLAVRGTAVELAAALEPPPELSLFERAYDGSAGAAWTEVRQALIEALSARPEAVGLLQRAAAQDPAAAVRAAAARALGRLGHQAPAVAAAPVAPSPYLGRQLDGEPEVTLETTRGPIRIRLFAADAPLVVQAFLARVATGFYDGLSWHRVVANFVVQGGDPRGDGWGGTGRAQRDEINRRRFVRGSVGLPKAGRDTGDCQLFITHLPTPHLDGNYTVFGQVVAGMDAVDALEVGDVILSARQQ